MKKSFVMGLLGLACAAGCGNTSPSSTSASEPVATGSSAIQGGTDDTTHNFAVGLFIMENQTSAICSGLLLAPNLVATARHCVSQLGADNVDCTTSTFAATLPAGDIVVTAHPTMTMTSSDYVTVASVHVPTPTSFCGNDIALLILSKSIDLPQYVTPTINPPMTDHGLYSTAVTTIGYGIDSPLDDSGTSAGTRRIKENVNLVCIPSDTKFTNCLSDPTWVQFATAQEFEGGDGTCDGDSGSGAYDQGSFNKGQWVAFGVLSRGGVSSEGGSCIGSFYSRFDAWGSLIIDAANEAAAMGGYAPPSWAVSSPQQTPGAPGACLANTTACLQDSDCCSVNCISHDNNVTSFCTACDADNPCNTGFGCQGGLCVAGAPSSVGADSGIAAQGASATHAGGCAVGGVGAESPLPWSRAAAGFAVAALLLSRRKRSQDSGPAGSSTVPAPRRNPKRLRSIRNSGPRRLVTGISVAVVASACGARTGLSVPDQAAPACTTPTRSANVPDCDGQSTTLGGTVYDPAGNNPLYDVVVYVPGSTPGPLPSGATCDSCSDLYTGSPITTALTDAQGHFVLRNVPPGKDVPLVLQIGKWRRQLRVPNVLACQDNLLVDGSLTLPKNRTEGDIPAIAVSTGGSDTLECLFRRIGVDAIEYTGDPQSAGRIHIFQGMGNGNRPAPNTAAPAPISATALWDSVADLRRYDMVFLSCEGQETVNMNQQALFDYAASGGRVFASHFHYAWFQDGPFGTWNLATWTQGMEDIGDIDAVVTTTLPGGAPFVKGSALAQWLGNLGALLPNGELPIQKARHNADLGSANTASQSWLDADADASTPGATQSFSFNTPLGAPPPSQCGQVVYSAMHVGAASNDDPDLPVPDECAPGGLSPQEMVLEFLVFNLSSCVMPTDQTPQAPRSCP